MNDQARQLDLERDTKQALRRADIARGYGAAGAATIAHIFATGGLFEKNAAADHPHFNPMAAGALEGTRRMCLELIEKTIGFDAAIKLLAERIAANPIPALPAQSGARAQIDQNTPEHRQ